MTIGKEAYLLEVPESLRGRVPRDYELRSSKKVSMKKHDESSKSGGCCIWSTIQRNDK